MAARSSGRQGVGVYFVCPRSSAALAASLMKAGVSKSGSPAPKPTTSMPAFFIALALALTARVIESLTSFIRSARANMGESLEKSRESLRTLPDQSKGGKGRRVSPTFGRQRTRGLQRAASKIPEDSRCAERGLSCARLGRGLPLAAL